MQAIVANYFVAGALGWSAVPANTSIEISDWGAWPFVIGVLFITLFQLMAKVTQEHGVNVVSVTVKMSVVIPILSGIFLLSDSISALNAVGILAALIAVYAINRPSQNNSRTNSWLGLVVLFTGSGLLDAILKYAEHNVVNESATSAFTSTAFAIAGGLGILFILTRVYLLKNLNWDRKSWLWGFALGIPNYGSIYFLLKALQGDLPSAILFPINNVGIVALSAIVAFAFYKERITNWKIAGLLLGGLAIVLMSV